MGKNYEQKLDSTAASFDALCLPPHSSRVKTWPRNRKYINAVFIKHSVRPGLRGAFNKGGAKMKMIPKESKDCVKYMMKHYKEIFAGLKQKHTEEATMATINSEKILDNIMQQREKILEAFIAETGLKPSECEQVFQGNKWYVRKRKDNSHDNN